MKKTLSIISIIALGLIVYSNTFHSSFHFDDDAYIVHNYAIRNIQNLLDIWNVCPCRFLTFLSLALNYHFNGLNVFAYHLFNILIHLGAAIMVWWLIQLTFLTPALKKEKIAAHANSISLLAALLFVSHPIQTEAVTYIWQRAASLTAFLYLTSLCLYIKARLIDLKAGTHNNAQIEELTIGPGILYYILSLITAVLAMFSKENAITLPLMVILYELSFFKVKKPMVWIQLFPYLLFLFIIPRTMVLTMSTRFGEIQSIVGGPGGISPVDYLMTQLRVIITYIRLLFLPIYLNLDYDYPVYKSLFETPVLISLLSLTAILYFAKHLYSKYRLLSFSIFWFFLTLLPESSILPQTDVIFEHRLYLPMVGYVIFLVSGAFYLLEKNTFKKMIIIFSLIIIVNSALTFERNKIWKNDTTLWEDIVSKSPHKARAHINRGWAYYNQGNFTQAMADFNEAIAIDPKLVYPYDDKGLIYANQGNLTQAISEYNKAIKISTYYSKIYYDRGTAFLMQNDYSQAQADYNKAIKLNPLYVDAYNDRAKLEVQEGHLTQAITDFTKSLTIDPNQPDIAVKLFSLHSKRSNV